MGRTLSKSVIDTRLRGVSDTLEVRAVIERHLKRTGWENVLMVTLCSWKNSCPNIAKHQAHHILGCICKCVASRLRKGLVSSVCNCGTALGELCPAWGSSCSV